jgi:hypothetical protein
MINLRQFEIVIHINVGIVSRHVVALEGRLGVLHSGVNAKDKAQESQTGRRAGIGFQVELDEENALIQKRNLFRVAHRRGFRMEGFHFQAQDIFALSVAVRRSVVVVMVAAAVHTGRSVALVLGKKKRRRNVLFVASGGG